MLTFVTPAALAPPALRARSTSGRSDSASQARLGGRSECSRTNGYRTLSVARAARRCFSIRAALSVSPGSLPDQRQPSHLASGSAAIADAAGGAQPERPHPRLASRM
jgi:hypothetical protein